MADDTTCKHGRTPDACEDCLYTQAVAEGRIQPNPELTSRGADKAPVRGAAEDEQPAAAKKGRAVTHRPAK